VAGGAPREPFAGAEIRRLEEAPLAALELAIERSEARSAARRCVTRKRPSCDREQMSSLR
jgi:hypothetical protein